MLNATDSKQRAFGMSKRQQQGSAVAVIVIAVVIVLLGALGFLAWKNFFGKATTNDESNTVTITNGKMYLTELGNTLDMAGAPYQDITYTMTSFTQDDTAKNVAAIYSKDLNARLVADAKKQDTGADLSETYWKLAGNRAVYAYYYETADTQGVDGVKGRIINPREKTASAKLYVGFMGPGAPSSDALIKENATFRDWVIAHLK